MAGHILIVEATSSQRIQLRGLLVAAHYDTLPSPDSATALQLMAESRPELVLLGASIPRHDRLALLAAIRDRSETAAVPVIMLTDTADPEPRLAALRAGADDVLHRDTEPGLLLARIRSLLRERDATSDLRLGGGAARALGMADPAQGFTPAGRSVIVTRRPACLPPTLAALAQRLPGGAVFLDPDADPGGSTAADLFIIDHSGSDDDDTAATALFRLIADLRARPATRHAKIMVIAPADTKALARMALDLGANDLVPDTVSRDELAFRVRALLRRKGQADRRRDRVESGLTAALTDPLTGLANRRHAMAELEVLSENLAAGGPVWSAILFDIDHFKRVNDSHGHATGDQVLCAVARLLRDNLRLSDQVARIGGEEFLVLLPDTPRVPACIVAQRLCRLVEEAQITIDGALPLRITLSAGVATAECTSPGASAVNRILERADRALYAAKSAGRNQVTVAPADRSDDSGDGSDDGAASRLPVWPVPRLPVLLPDR